MKRKVLASIGEMLLRLGIQTDHPGLRPTAEESARVGRSMGLRRALLAGAFVPHRSRSLGHRMALVLAWAAQRYPREFVDQGTMVAVLLGVSRKIASRSAVRAVLASAFPGARAALGRKGQYIVTLPGVALRATTGKLDIEQNVRPRDLVRVRSALRSFLRAVEMIVPIELHAVGFASYSASIREMDADLATLERWRSPLTDERVRYNRLVERLDAEADRRAALAAKCRRPAADR